MDQFVFQSAPAALLPGETTSVTVAFKNTGRSTWPAGTSSHLGSQNPADNTTWGLSRVSLSTDVLPGGVATFAFQITAPSSAGTYSWELISYEGPWSDLQMVFATGTLTNMFTNYNPVSSAFEQYAFWYYFLRN